MVWAKYKDSAKEIDCLVPPYPTFADPDTHRITYSLGEEVIFIADRPSRLIALSFVEGFWKQMNFQGTVYVYDGNGNLVFPRVPLKTLH